MPPKEEPIKPDQKEEEEGGPAREEAKKRWHKIDLSVLEKNKETYISCLVLSVISIVMIAVTIHMAGTFVCQFVDLEDAFMDRLICGIRDTRLQRCLLAKYDLTLKKAIDKALVAEVAEQSSTKIQSSMKPQRAQTQGRTLAVHQQQPGDPTDSEFEEVHRTQRDATRPLRRDALRDLGLLERWEKVKQRFDDLRDTLVNATGEEKFKKCHPKQIAEKVKWLSNRIDSSRAIQVQLFNEHLDVVLHSYDFWQLDKCGTVIAPPSKKPQLSKTGMKKRTFAFPKVHTWPPFPVMMNRSSRYSWQSHGKNFYYFSKGEKSWYEAEDFCISRGAHLASVLSDDEQNFISSQLQNRLWIGLTTGNKEGIWRWSDGSRLDKENWVDDQPSNRRGSWKPNQDCVMMEPTLSNHNWKVNSCHKPHRWVCKGT